jgi:uncharacterized membrane protein
VYGLLKTVGYTHPIHPPVTHIPMGMVMGGFLFAMASFKRQELAKTAYHCIVLAFISAPVVAVLGIMDWQHRYMGSWTNLIIAKMILAVVFMVLLAAAVYLNRKGNIDGKIMIVVYALCLLAATGLGFIGGELIFG